MGKQDKARRVKGGYAIGKGHREVFIGDSLLEGMANWLDQPGHNGNGTRRDDANRVREWLRRAYRP